VLLLSTTPLRLVGGVEVYLHIFFTSALEGSEWQLHVPAPLPPGIEPLMPIG